MTPPNPPRGHKKESSKEHLSTDIETDIIV